MGASLPCVDRAPKTNKRQDGGLVSKNRGGCEWSWAASNNLTCIPKCNGWALAYGIAPRLERGAELFGPRVTILHEQAVMAVMGGVVMTPTTHGTGAAQRQPGFAADAVSAAMVLSF